jgi:DNA-binding transcriptional LysR family regulator
MAEKRPPAPRFSYKGDRLKPLRAFCQTARLGSVSRAAEALFLSQPAVTQQLQALEREMGAKLFERSGRRLVPTREGEMLYELARPLVEGIDGLDAAFREQVRGLDAGELHVAAGSSTILYLLPRIVEAFRAAQPGVRLILPPRRLTTYRLVDPVFQKSRVPYTVALEVGGWEVIKQYVAMGLGISIVTAICLGESDRGRLAARSLAPWFPQRSYGVVLRKGKYLSPQARAFVDLIKPDLFVRAHDESGHSER